VFLSVVFLIGNKCGYAVLESIRLLVRANRNLHNEVRLYTRWTLRVFLGFGRGFFSRDIIDYIVGFVVASYTNRCVMIMSLKQRMDIIGFVHGDENERKQEKKNVRISSVVDMVNYLH